jgi:deoxyribodipyrimidine photo-lyase
MSFKQQISIFWFRRDLRLDDNTGLQHALDSNYPVLPIFIFDPQILNKLVSKQDGRVEFIYREISKIKSTLEQHGSTLQIFHDTPENVFGSLLNQYRVEGIFSNRDYEPYALERDNKIKLLLAGSNIRFNSFKDHVIFEGKEVLKQDGTPFKVFTPFKKVWLQHFESSASSQHSVPPLFENFLKTDPISAPTLETLGFEKTFLDFPISNIDFNIINNYHQHRDYPAMNGTSRIGVHLRFGTVSIRKLVALAKKHNDTWLNELIWREFYSSVLQHFPYVVSGAFNKKYDHIPWRNNETEFRKWCMGDTGYPMVDAGMRELNNTGYMHNRVRMVTASFLTKHLLIDWKWGELYFAQKLLDFELASNNGGWQWAAGTGTDAQPYFRVFNPESQAEKFDPKSEYIKKWIPEFGTKAYPSPMVDHKQARLRAIETYKRALL